MHEPVTIKFLKGVPLKLASQRHLFKLMETYALMKSIWVDEPMPDTTAAKTHLATLSGRSKKTIDRRINQLVQENFVQVKSGTINPISWDALATRFEIRHIHFHRIKPSKHVQLQYILEAKAIDEKQKQCAAAFKIRVNYVSYLKTEIESVAGSVDSGAVANHQLQCYVKGGKGYTQDEQYLLDMHYKMKESKLLRGDLQVSYRKLKRMFDYKGNGSIAYRKRLLQRLGVISIEKRREKIENGVQTTTGARTNRLGFVKWNEDKNILELILPDKITVLSLKYLDTRFEYLQAAAKKANAGDSMAQTRAK